jgi:hypothetical protein
VTVSNTVTPPPVGGGLTVAVTQPAGGATVNGTNWAVVWVTGATGTNTYTLTSSGKTVGNGTGSGTGPVTIPWNTTAVADGAQTLTVSVRDGSGKTGSVTVSVNVRNTTAPLPAATGSLEVAMTQPTGNATVSGTTWVVLWVTGATGTSQFTLTVDGTSVGVSTGTGGGPVTIPWTTSGSANGTHTLQATVRDGAGKTGTSSNVAVTVAN